MSSIVSMVCCEQQDHPGIFLEALDRDCGHACVRLHWRGSLVPWRGLGGLRWWHVRMVLHPLRDLRWRGRICCWRAWISQQVHPGLVRHHASHCHCRLVYLPSRLLLWLPHGWCQRLQLEPHLQPCRFRQQDRLLLGHLAGCQEREPWSMKSYALLSFANGRQPRTAPWMELSEPHFVV